MNKPSQRRENRICAIQFLYQWELNRPEPNTLAHAVGTFLESQDRESPREYYQFCEELIYGAIENIEEVDSRIRLHANNWKFERIAKVDLAILRLAIYELLFRKDIPPIVSINEAIDLSKTFSNQDSKRFINGILDKMKDRIGRPLRQAAR